MNYDHDSTNFFEACGVDKHEVFNLHMEIGLNLTLGKKSKVVEAVEKILRERIANGQERVVAVYLTGIILDRMHTLVKSAVEEKEIGEVLDKLLRH